MEGVGQPLSGERFSEKTENKSNQVRVDISAHGFWLTGQSAFFDVRVFNPTAKRWINLKFRKSHGVNEKEKKKQYNERILQVEHGTLTPLVMSTTGDMGRGIRKFYTRLSEMISEKRKENYAFIASWIRKKINFALANSLCIGLRGNRSVYYISNTNWENSLSSFAKVSEVTSSVGATLLSFWVSYIT